VGFFIEKFIDLKISVMIDFIPLEYYTPIFYYFTLILVFILVLKINVNKKLSDYSISSYLLVWGLIFYIGFRPISGGLFGDMRTYATMFEQYSSNVFLLISDDVGFEYFMKYTSKIIDIVSFFVLCAFLYVYSHYLMTKRIFKQYWYYAFLILVCSFSFWSYGTNGLRNGLALSFVLLAFSYDKNKKVAFLIAFLAVSFHKSSLLPLFAYCLTFIYNKPKGYLIAWFLCIPLSLILGGSFEIFFASLGFGDDRLSYLTDGNVNDDEFSSTGFRWDFLLYSSTAVCAGWYFIIKKKFQDIFYNRLLNTYLIANSFWILIIRANFSNRFAYLSWFMMGLIIIYPFLKGNFMPNQPMKMAVVILFYFMFTFILNVILAK
jgi:hypothetical protein